MAGVRRSRSAKTPNNKVRLLFSKNLKVKVKKIKTIKITNKIIKIIANRM